MTTSPKLRAVFWGIRLTAFSAMAVFAYRAYKADHYVGLVGILFSVILGFLSSIPTRQAEKLAIQNMKKYGLTPDRDEAQPARKAIDNRS